MPSTARAPNLASSSSSSSSSGAQRTTRTTRSAGSRAQPVDPSPRDDSDRENEGAGDESPRSPEGGPERAHLGSVGHLGLAPRAEPSGGTPARQAPSAPKRRRDDEGGDAGSDQGRQRRPRVSPLPPRGVPAAAAPAIPPPRVPLRPPSPLAYAFAPRPDRGCVLVGAAECITILSALLSNPAAHKKAVRAAALSQIVASARRSHRRPVSIPRHATYRLYSVLRSNLYSREGAGDDNKIIAFEKVVEDFIEMLEEEE